MPKPIVSIKTEIGAGKMFSQNKRQAITSIQTD
jgi:hypothetical protein